MGFKVAINPGHWLTVGPGYDPGAVGHGLKEAEVVRLIAPRVRNRLVQLGLDVDDVAIIESPTLAGIVTLANIFNADIFVSLHCNAFDGVARGVEIFSYRYGSKNSHELNHKIFNEIKWSQRNEKRTPMFWRGEKRAGFYVIKHTKMPAVLVEMGFIDNWQDAQEMKTLSWQNMMANAIAHGIVEYAKSKGAL